MIIKAKYKVARRLGSPIFEKTQSPKYSIREARRKEKARKHPRIFTDFGKQLTEKQKIRYTYLVNEKQLKKYVGKVLGKKGIKQDQKLYETLEGRLDSVAYRAGFGKTRLSARQIVTHGHLCVNGKRVNVPSYQVRKGDFISVRPGSVNKPLFISFEEKLKDVMVSDWLKVDLEKKGVQVSGLPRLEKREAGVDFNMVMDYYKR